MRSFFAKTTPIAVDLGSGSLRAVQLEQTSDGVAVRHWLRHTTPLKDDEPVCPSDRGPIPPEVNVRREAGFVGREAVLCLGLNEVECCPLRVPENLLNLGREQLLGALKHEVARQLSSPIDTVELDYWRLVPTEVDGPNVMVAAAKQAAIQQIIEWADAQRLTCRRIDLAPLAAMRTCAAMVGSQRSESILGVLDIGRTSSRLCIGIGDVPIYVRRMQRGGDAMTQRISDELQVGRAVAERYKTRFGIAGPATGYRPFQPGDEAADEQRMASILQSVLHPIIQGWCEEVKSSFHYAMEYYPGRPIGGLMLVGGGANLGGLCERTGQMLGIEVVRPSGAALPGRMASLTQMQDEVLAEMAGPIGSCLGEMAA